MYMDNSWLMEQLPKWCPVVTAKVECCTAYPCFSIPNLQYILQYCNSLQSENRSKDVVEAKVLLVNNTCARCNLPSHDFAGFGAFFVQLIQRRNIHGWNHVHKQSRNLTISQKKKTFQICSFSQYFKGNRIVLINSR